MLWREQEQIVVSAAVKGAYWISSNFSFIQYCYRNIGLFSIAHPKVIALPTCDSKVVALNPFCFNFCISFVDLFMASFLYCFPYSYRSSNYCDSNICRSFTLLKALAKSKSTHIAIAFKRNNSTFPLRYRL